MRDDPKKFLYGGLVALVAGCGPVAAEMEATGEVMAMTEAGLPTTGVAGTTGVSGVTGVLDTTAGMGTTGTGSSTGEVDGMTFVIEPDGGVMVECDLFLQQCPAGQKCMPYASDGGGSWDDTKCVPVMEDPAQVDEPCFVVDSGVSGIDNCDLGLMCWDADAKNQGECIALCTGTVDAPTCADPQEACATSSGVLALCLDMCDPLLQSCDSGFACIGYPNGLGFLCVLDASGDEGQVHDPCMYANSCDPGLMCLDSAAAVECDAQAQGCCQPFCDLEEPNVCAGQGQVCSPYFEGGSAPQGYEDVGYCAVMM